MAVEVGDRMQYVTRKRNGKSMTLTTHEGTVKEIRTVTQAMVKPDNGRNGIWVDLEPEDVAPVADIKVEMLMALETLHGILLNGMTADHDLMTEELGRARLVIEKAKKGA